MAEWLSIIGIGEDGVAGLGKASHDALAAAEVVFGAPRHLAMIAHADKRPWPVPFSIDPVLAMAGRRVAVLASGDPFWHGAGGSLAAAVAAGSWRAYPAVPIFSLMAARLGWRLEAVCCLGLHAAPFARMRRHLFHDARLLVTLRDGAAMMELAEWLVQAGWGESRISVMERLGGPHERLRHCLAKDWAARDIAAPVAAAIEVAGAGLPLTLASGRADALFAHDGQITKRPVRALALSALAPRGGELLWDIGAGSGSVGIEWLLAHPSMRAIAVERDPARAARAQANAQSLGVALEIHQGAALDLIAGLPDPQAVFIGGGADAALIAALWQRLPKGCRIVGHAVTLETECLFANWQASHGGTLLRIALSEAAPLGTKRGWQASYPVVQWSVTR